ncbi:MAG TPA: DUF4345 domain-containing protein [Candidatus Acidoferrales bacterium]|nr:DUF4345 domain-containing protein [Candidatus Acidoferrales bacterium]
MNPRITTIIVGSIILILGFAGLVYPDRIMGLLGFSMPNPSHGAAALGEVRATYGGLFAVMGVYTLLAAMDPAAHRARLTFVGLMWLGACAGRLLGASIDGNPGLPGWLTALFELIMGGTLVATAWLATGNAAPSPSQP